MNQYSGKYQEALIEAIRDNGGLIRGVFERYDGDAVSSIEFNLDHAGSIHFFVEGSEYNSPSDYIRDYFERYGALGNSNAADPATAVLGGSYHIFRRMNVLFKSVQQNMEQVMELYGVDMSKSPTTSKSRSQRKSKVSAHIPARKGIFQKHGDDILFKLAKIHGRDQVCRDADDMTVIQFELKYGI